MNKIHPLATVSPKAVLGDNVEVGPYAFIDENVQIGDGCKIHPHAVIFPYVKMGKNCEVYPGAVVGAVPQDLKFEGEVTYVEIGDNVTIRECVTINRGTKASGKGITKVGSNTLIMSYVHIAHDCKVGNHCILVSYVVIDGETEVEVLGTKFNVRAYNSEPEIVTTLVEGCVKATADGREMFMKPAEEISYNVKSGEMRKYDAPNKNHLIPWRDNELFFNGNNLKEIGAILERMYNVNVIFEDESVTAYSYTGLVRNSSLNNVLDLITATSPVEAQMYYNTIKFSRRRTGRK